MSIIIGGNQADTIIGSSRSDIISSGNGNDVINAGAGNDIVFAGNGNDTVNGGAGSDIIDGGNGDDVLNGGADSDIVSGGNGNDNVDGGSGSDIVSGGNGNDTLLYDIIDNLGSIDIYSGDNGYDTLIMRLDLSRYSSSMFSLNTLTQMINNFNNNASTVFTFAGINIDLALLGIEKIQLQTYGQVVNIVAQNDSYTFNEDTIFSGNILSNDTAPVGSTVSLVGATIDGLTLNANGTFSYQPAQNFSGQTSFTYQITYNGLTSNTGTVNFTVQNVNDAPIGAPLVVGSAVEDQVLTVDVSQIADADGLGALSFQWLRDGQVVSGATAAQYALGDADVGKQISVRVSYTDAKGTAESLTSDQTAAVQNVNDAPVGAPLVVGSAIEDQVLTVDVSQIADADGLGALSYQWLRDGQVVSGATAAQYALGDADVGKQISVRVSYTDAKGTAESLTSDQTAAVQNINDAPTGIVTISGTSGPGETLTASNTLADVDGLGLITYQWVADGIDISGATQSSILLTQALLGKTISVKATYVDGQGTTEIVQSAQNLLVSTPTVFVPTTIVDNTVVVLSGGNDVLDTRSLQGVNYVTSTGSLSAVVNGQNSSTVVGAESYILKTGDNIRIDSAGNFDVTADGNTVITLVEGNSINLDLIRGLATPIIQMEFNNSGPNLTNTAFLDFANKSYSFNATAIEYALITALVPNVGGFDFSLPYTYTTIDLTGLTGVTAKITELLSLPSNFFSQYGQANPTRGVEAVVGANLLEANQSINPDTADFSEVDTGVRLASNQISDILSQDTGASFVSALTQIDNPFLTFYKLINFEKVILTNHNDLMGSNITGNYFVNDTINYVDMGGGFDTLSMSTAQPEGPIIDEFGTGQPLFQDAISISYNGTTNTLNIFNADTALLSKTITILNVEHVIATTRNDTLVSGQQNEVFTGNAGADNFVFLQDSGQDVITDFTTGLDKINLDAYNTSFGSLSMTQNGTDVVINLGVGDSLTLNNLNIGSLSASDFIF